MIGSFFRAAARTLLASGVCVIVFDAAAEYPDRPIRYIVPVAVGGAGDISARLLTAELAIQMNQPFVIDNRASSAGSSVCSCSRARGRMAIRSATETWCTLRSIRVSYPISLRRRSRAAIDRGVRVSNQNVLAVRLPLPVKS